MDGVAVHVGACGAGVVRSGGQVIHVGASIERGWFGVADEWPLSERAQPGWFGVGVLAMRGLAVCDFRYRCMGSVIEQKSKQN